MTAVESTGKRARLLAAFDEGVARASGFGALQGPSWGRRLQRALAFKGRFLEYLLHRFVDPGSAKARVFWGKRYLWGRPEHSTSMYLFGVLEHTAEVRLTRFMIRSLPVDAVFFDVGANFGFYSLLAAEILESGRVCSFEPVPYVFESMARNARAAGKIQPVNCAVSDRVGVLAFDQAPESRHTGSSFDEEGSREPGAPRFEFTKIQVKSTTIDAYRAESGLTPTVIKIDVEGAEKLVIEGARGTLSAAAPTVILEVWKPPMKNQNHRDASRMLQDLGYRPHSLTVDGGLRALDAAALEEEFSGGEAANLVFTKG